MTLAPFFVFVLPIITIAVVAAVGSTRRLGFWLTLIAAVLLTPIGGYILAVLSGAKQRKPQRRRRRRFWQRAAPRLPEPTILPPPGTPPPGMVEASAHGI